MSLPAAEAHIHFACRGLCHCELEHQHPKRIVLTGGPGAGKTAVLETAARTFCKHVAVVPEAASITFSGGFPRIATITGQKAAQRVIFHVQRELESLAETENHFALAICDRGTVDGLAYWPNSAGEFFSSLGTSLQHELDRYAAVIHLRTPPIERGYNHDNQLRTETAAEAAVIDDKIEEAWSTHPARVIIPSEVEFPAKVAKALEVIRRYIPPCCASTG